MPSKSPAQHRLMEAAAHTKGGFAGVSQAVGREFASADKGKKFEPKTRDGIGGTDGSHAHGYGR